MSKQKPKELILCQTETEIKLLFVGFTFRVYENDFLEYFEQK